MDGRNPGGDVHRSLGHVDAAEKWSRAAWTRPVAHERLGRLYEEMGRSEVARTAYRQFTEAWTNADPKLQDRVEKARGRREALSESKATE